MYSPYPAIPDPQPTVESLTDSVRMLKLAVELLTRQRGNGGASHVFYQDDTPVAVSTGDLWIDMSASRLRFWNGTEWANLTIV